MNTSWTDSIKGCDERIQWTDSMKGFDGRDSMKGFDEKSRWNHSMKGFNEISSVKGFDERFQWKEFDEKIDRLFKQPYWSNFNQQPKLPLRLSRALRCWWASVTLQWLFWSALNWWASMALQWFWWSQWLFWSVFAGLRWFSKLLSSSLDPHDSS